MNDINILNIRPNNSNPQNNGAYIAYEANLETNNHTINGNFLATNSEVKNASEQNNQDWSGFKKLVLSHLENDIKNLASK